MKTVGALVAGREVYHVRVEQTVREAARYMADRRVGAVAVLQGDRLAGILSERDIIAATSWWRTRVRPTKTASAR